MLLRAVKFREILALFALLILPIAFLTHQELLKLYLALA